MDRNEAKSGQNGYTSLERLIKDAYGLNPSQMIQRMEWAQQEVQSEHPLNGRPIKEPPTDGFQTILAKMEARGITPRVMADFDTASQKWLQDGASWTEGPLPHEKDRAGNREDWSTRAIEVWDSLKMVLQKPVKTAGVVVAGFILVAAILLIPRIDAIATRRFAFDSRVRDGSTGTITWNNQDDRTTDIGDLEEAYEKIKEGLDAATLKLNYIPKEMKLSSFSIKRENASLEFTYKNNQVYVFEILYSVDNTYTRGTDCPEYTAVFNRWFDREILIQRNELPDGQFEYMTYFEEDDMCYYIQGIMPEQDFLKIVENLALEY
ncbi:MAG: DUF4367 domain-containing protein [Lachnospiraceae bacterium]|nr:DUF4367 domain-containing protein [Lachnospiraceae bacterium]